jgi:antitoxin (DNA-binding transcriptional repressor) of toxin-antitoxin stability system
VEWIPNFTTLNVHKISTARTLIGYNWSMTVTATDFRKNLFQLMERALKGELIEIVHKDRTIRLAPIEPSSKISRLVRRDTLTCTADEFDTALRAQDEEMRKDWEQKWQSRL